jgi:protein TonB
MFDHLIISSDLRQRRPPQVLAFSLFLHGSVLAVLLVAPLLFYQQLPGSELLTLLILDRPEVPTPPVPPPSPPPQPVPVLPHLGEPLVVKLSGMMKPPPEAIPAAPDASVFLDDIPYLPRDAELLRWGPSGGERLAGLPEAGAAKWHPAPPPPPATPRKEPRHVSSGVQAARLVRKVEPEYPPLAATARIQGIVSLQVRIDEEGSVTSVEVLSGHRLLREAAVEAVRQWKYSPTILNGEPWPVLANVTVRFVLN